MNGQVNVQVNTIDNEPALVVRVRRACELLDCSRPKLYRLIAAGEVNAYRDGGSRKVEIASIKGYIKRKIEQERLRRKLPPAQG